MLRNLLLLYIVRIRQVESSHIIVYPGHTGCQMLLDHNVYHFVQLVRETPFLAKTHLTQ